jgi:tetratricopeptide (TPR) repeat protein
LGYSQATPEVKAPLASCQESLEKKDYTNTIMYCNEVLQRNPSSAEAYNNIGLAYAAVDDLTFAVRNADQAIALDPQKADYYRNRAAIKIRLDEGEEAHSDYAKAIELSPSYAPYYYERGILFQRQDLIEAAMADYTKSIELDSKFAPPYKELAKIDFDKGDVNKALSYANKFLEIQPDDLEILVRRGRMYRLKHDQKEPTNEKLLTDALSDCTKAAAKDPRYGPAHACQASVYLSQNQFDKCIASATKAVDLNFTEGVYVTRAIARFKLKEYNTSKEDVMKAIDLGETPNAQFLDDLTKAMAAETAAALAVKAKADEAVAAIAAREAAEKEAAAKKATEEAAASIQK